MLECIIVIFAVAIDQLTKLWVITGLLDRVITVIPGVLDFEYVKNTGAAFGWFSEGTAILAALSVVMSIVIIFVLIKYRKSEGRFFAISLAMILGGAIGNLIDRVARGYVVDFIEPTFVNFAVFNVADCFVTIGTACIVIYAFFMMDKRHALLAAADKTKTVQERAPEDSKEEPLKEEDE